MTRPFDVVVFGATGFTGALVAEYLSTRTERPWAIAGRSRDKLAKVAASVSGRKPELVVADVSDPGSLAAMAASTRVVLNLVGPYIHWGEPVVKACLEAGTDQVDLTGEPEYVANLVRDHDATARAKGVRIVPCCGFDSVPHDLGAMWTVRQLPQDRPIEVSAVVRGAGAISGGTWASAVEAFGRPQGAKARIPRPPEASRPVHGKKGAVRRDAELKSWIVALPTIDPQIVLRSASVLDGYGTDFTYGHYFAIRRTTTLLGGAVALGGVAALAQVKPGRRLLQKLRPSGAGPDEATRAKSRFSVTFQASAGDARLVTQVSGGDPGYGETSKMISECALSLVEDRDRLPARAGILSPAMAFEERLVERLVAAGLSFEVLG